LEEQLTFLEVKKKGKADTKGDEKHRKLYARGGKKDCQETL